MDGKFIRLIEKLPGELEIIEIGNDRAGMSVGNGRIILIF